MVVLSSKKPFSNFFKLKRLYRSCVAYRRSYKWIKILSVESCYLSLCGYVVAMKPFSVFV